MRNRTGIIFPFLKETLVIVVLAIVTTAPFMMREWPEMHGDEAYWVKCGIFFKLFFVDGDLHNALWDREHSYDHPPVGKYIIGLTLFASGYGHRIDELFNLPSWDYLRKYDWNIRHGASLPFEILYGARSVMAALGILTCLCVYWIGRRARGIITGIAACVLLAYNNLMTMCCTRAMGDAPLLLFTSLNVIMILLFYDRFLKQKNVSFFVAAALVGITGGLAAGTKLIGALCGIIFSTFCLLLFFAILVRPRAMRRRRSDIAKLIAGMLIAGSFTMSIFIGLNPFLYKQPVKRMIFLIGHGKRRVLYQQTAFPSDALKSLKQKFGSVVTMTLLPNDYAVLGRTFKIPLDLYLFLFGTAMLLYGEIRNMCRTRIPGEKGLVLVWLFVTFAGTILWIPMRWDRYYLPVVPCIVIAMGYGVETIVAACRQVLRKKPSLMEPHGHSPARPPKNEVEHPSATESSADGRRSLGGDRRSAYQRMRAEARRRINSG